MGDAGKKKKKKKKKKTLSIVLGKFVLESNFRSATTTFRDTRAWAVKDYKEVHTEDTDGRVVFDAEINVFLNTETKATIRRELAFLQFVFFNFQSRLQNFFSFWSSDGHAARDLFVSSDTE